ncbi:MAG: ATP-binding protein [Candidatus Zixiibacteriota bacterium]
MAKRLHKYETEVHLGLLLIICVLLTLNVVSNYTIFRARTWQIEDITSHLQKASLAITRVVEGNSQQQLSEVQRREFRAQYGLSGVTLVASGPDDNSPETRRRWFVSIARDLPVGSLPRMAERLLAADFKKLTRAEGNEYFFVSPIPNGKGQNLLILSTNVSELALLDDASRLIFMISVASLVVVIVMYLALSRKIFAPIRKIRKEAQLAGRSGAEVETGDEVAAEYRRVISELRDKENELLRLNRELQNRAESLEQFNQYLLASVDTGIVTMDMTGRVLEVNSAAGRILGVTPEVSRGIAISELLGGYPMPAGDVHKMLDAHAGSSYREYTVSAVGGRKQTLGITTSFVRNSDGELVGLSLIVNDLSELRQLRAELEQRSRLVALGEMAGGIAHQLRNSLGAIAGYSTLARRKAAKGEEIDSAVESISDETRQAELLIERFLTFARPITPNFGLVRIDQFLAEIVDSFRLREEYRALQFHLDCTTELEMALDPLLFKQAVCNLIDNAARAYAPRSGTVTVRAAMCGSEFVIHVIDEADGIDAEHLESIFTPFYSSRPSGTGLGLPLACRMVDLHGGRITVQSTAGQGSVFTIHVPIGLSVPDIRPQIRTT